MLFRRISRKSSLLIQKQPPAYSAVRPDWNFKWDWLLWSGGTKKRELFGSKPTRSKLPVVLYLLGLFLGFIMTFGFFNNFIVLVLFCKFKTLRTPVNVLLLNISVSDMLVCMFGTTLSFASSVRGRWLLGRNGCMWYGFINSCFGIVSLISLVVLSYDRYSTLTVYHNRGPDYRKPLLAVGGSWLYSLIWTVPPLLGWSSYGFFLYWDIFSRLKAIKEK
uniref:Teleost multiple tissue opsin 2b n=1 Tax=Sinocyclocheilus grahami TaxID=75366 RepID=A0A672K3G5_SINGR